MDTNKKVCATHGDTVSTYCPTCEVNNGYGVNIKHECTEKSECCWCDEEPVLVTVEVTLGDMLGVHYVTVHDGTSELCICTDGEHEWTERIPYSGQRAVAGAMTHRAKGGLIGD